jgi:spermidine synthase
MRQVLARQTTQNGEFQLQRRGEDVYELIYNGVFLMASYNEPSARALATLALSWLPPTRGHLQVLVGGLGMGYTLAAALADARVDSVDIVEIEPLIVRWNREHLGHLAGEPLADPRSHLYEADVVTFLRATDARYDAVLLDVDNGPNWLAIDSNEQLYDVEGQATLQRHLAPGGVLGIWASETCSTFLDELAAAFSAAAAQEVIDTAPDGHTIEATIYLARSDTP